MTEQATRPDPYVGMDLGESTHTIDATLVGNYHEGLAVEPVSESWVPSMTAGPVDDMFTGRGGFADGYGNLWMRQAWKFRGPMAKDLTYRTSAKVTDIYQKRDRTVVVNELKIEAGGNVVATAEHHQSYLVGDNAKKLNLRAPEAKGHIRGYDVPEGETIGTLSREITLEMCGSFFHGRRSYHTDKDASAELGFTDVVVGGRMTLSLTCAMLEAHFAEAWIRSGDIDVKFTNIVWPGDTITTHGVIIGDAPDDSSRAALKIWVDKPDGTVVLVGDASVSKSS